MTIDTHDTHGEETHQGGVALPSVVNFIAGLWLIAAPFALEYAAYPDRMWNDIATGIAIVFLAAIRVLRPAGTTGLSWLSFVLGAWLVASPFVLGNVAANFWNDVTIGVVVLILSASSASARIGGSPDA